MRTLLFCTSYAETLGTWDTRWGLWLKAITKSDIRFDQLLIVDDGSPVLPNWPGIEVLSIGTEEKANSRLTLHHFQDRLGRNVGGQPFPGWYRSFGYAVMYGIREGFDRIIHVESDAFVISSRAVEFFNTCDRGWVSLWCRSYCWPESTLQIINSDRFESCKNFFSQPYSDHLLKSDSPIETLLPLTSINKDFVGDRYGEIGDTVPLGADFVSQIRWHQPPSYYWWIDDHQTQKQQDLTMPNLSTAMEGYIADEPDLRFSGVNYFEFLKFLDQQLCPVGYLEIGTENGRSVTNISCDSICIDPKFQINQDVIGKKARTLFFQVKSDDFFRNNDPRLLVKNIDIGFLDGLHLFEALLKDFINFERHSHSRSVALLHDCLPLNSRMTSRQQRSGPDDEDMGTRAFWTGDVWRVLPILKEFRPDLQIFFVDCPPTGLVLCSGLDHRSDVLLYAYERIVEQYASLSLDDFGIEKLWRLFPMLSSHRIMAEPREFCERFRFRAE
jgi:hypothetical protein